MTLNFDALNSATKYPSIDTYVLDVLGATITVRLVPSDPDAIDDISASRLKIVIEAPAPFTVDINGDSNDYGDEA